MWGLLFMTSQNKTGRLYAFYILNSISERSRESSGRRSQLRRRSAGHGRDEEEGRGEEERGGRQKMKKVIRSRTKTSLKFSYYTGLLMF